MADPILKWHQFLLNEKEVELYHELRRIQEDGNPTSNEDADKLRQMLYLSSYASDDRCLGRYPVDARNIIMECAQIGAEIRRKILSAPKIGAEVEEDPTTEQDNLDDTQLVYTDQEDVEMDNETISWDDVREDVIPPYVTEVTFTIPEEDLTAGRRKALEEHFPGVVIKAALLEPTCVAIGVEKPKGVKRAMLELDMPEVEADPTVLPRIQEMYPWASLHEDLAMIDNREDVPRRYDPQEYFLNFAQFTINPPRKDLFGFTFDIQSEWDRLSFAKKVAIAHAQAIQKGPYGMTKHRTRRCAHCTRFNYSCRVYRSIVATSSPHMNLGYECQNCRVWGKECDLGPRDGPAVDHMRGHNLYPDNLDSSTRGLSDDISSEATSASPESPEPNIGLSGQTTRDDPAWDGFAGGGEEAHSLQEARSPISPASDRMIEAVAEKINLELDEPDATFGIYAEWLQWKKISSYEENDQLDGYYASLVDLYIIATHQHMAALQYALLLKFQSTSITFEEKPKTSIILKAYKYLAGNAREPTTDPLCRWTAILCSYSPSREREGEYETFRKDQDRSMATAARKLINLIARNTCSSTSDRDATALKQWCEVHSHTSGSQDERLCNNTKRKSRLSNRRATPTQWG